MDFQDRMQAGRDAAAARRHKGLSTGASAKGWDAKPRPAAADKGDWHHERERIGVAWHMAKANAAWIYESMVFPERLFAGRTIDDAVAERLQAFNESIPF